MPETKEETKDVKDESSKPDDTDGGKIDSKKKKHIIIAGGIMGVLVLGYLWYENKNSQSSTGASTTQPAAVVQASDGGGGGWSGGGNMQGSGGGSSSPSVVTNNFDPVNNPPSQGPVGPGIGPAPKPVKKSPAGGTVVKKSPAKPVSKGGKSGVNGAPPVKSVAGTHTSGGVGKKSTSTATLPPTKNVTLRSGPINGTTGVNAASHPNTPALKPSTKASSGSVGVKAAPTPAAKPVTKAPVKKK